MTSLRPRHLPYSLPFPSTDTWTHPATILPRTTTIPSKMLAGRWARGEAWPSPDCPSPVPGTAGGPISGGFSGRKLANLSPPCFGETIGSSEGDGEKAPGSGWAGLRASGDLARLSPGRCGEEGGWRGSVGVRTALVFSFPPAESLTWLWPGRLRRSKRFLHGN